jgi:hypothetical protein
MYYLSEQQQKKTTKISFLHGQTRYKQNTVRTISNISARIDFLLLEYKQEKQNNNYPSKPNTSKSDFSSSIDLNEP